MNRATFDVAEKYAKDVAPAIKYLGTDRFPCAYALKAKAEYLLNKVPSCRSAPLYHASKLLPGHLSKRLLEHRDAYEHLLILVTADESIDESRRYLEEEWGGIPGVGFFECTEREEESALLHRFSAAGAGIRYQNVHQRTTEDVLALDIALLGNDPEGGPRSGGARPRPRLALSWSLHVPRLPHRPQGRGRRTDQGPDALRHGEPSSPRSTTSAISTKPRRS